MRADLAGTTTHDLQTLHAFTHLGDACRTSGIMKLNRDFVSLCRTVGGCKPASKPSTALPATRLVHPPGHNGWRIPNSLLESSSAPSWFKC